jgi:hypothetical protein
MRIEFKFSYQMHACNSIEKQTKFLIYSKMKLHSIHIYIYTIFEVSYKKEL